MKRKERSMALASVLHTVDVAAHLPIMFLTAAAMEAGADATAAGRIAREVFDRHLSEAPSVESARQLIREIAAATNQWAYRPDESGLTTFYVEDFGAVGDGVNDDYAAIQAALDAAGAMPEFVIVTSRTGRPFQVSQPLQVSGREGSVQYLTVFGLGFVAGGDRG